MERIAQTPVCTIYWLPEAHAGYGVWTGLPHLAPTQESLAIAEELLRERGGARWISNTQHAKTSPPETQAYIIQWLQRMAEGGLLCAWADIPPYSATARLVVKRLGEESTLSGIPFAQFATLDAACRWIQTKY